MFLRPFCSATDFSTCQQLIPAEWTFPGCTDEERVAHRTYVMTNMLSSSSYSLVAEDTDTHELLGVLFARFADLQPSEEHVAACHKRMDDMAAILEHGSDGARRAIAMERAVTRVHEVLDARAADRLVEHSELTLFCVAESARGRGIGTLLRTEMERHLLARGGRSYYLMTDAVCNIGYYESHGFERIATFSPETDKVGYPNTAYYYQKTLSPEEFAEAGTSADARGERRRDGVEHGIARESTSSEGDSPRPRVEAAPTKSAGARAAQTSSATPERASDACAETAPTRARVRYRPFDVERDLESAIDVVPEAWRPEDPAYDDAFVHELRYGLFAHLLRDANFLEVAVVDEPIADGESPASAGTPANLGAFAGAGVDAGSRVSAEEGVAAVGKTPADVDAHAGSDTPELARARERVVGVLAGRFGPMPEPPVPNPTADALEARSHRAMDAHPKGAKRRQYRAACDAANEAMIAQARHRDYVQEDNELVLFINDPSVRGQGVGATMLLRFEDFLRSRGAREYYLFTDTTCSYGYYERHGFTRVALCNDIEAEDDIAIFLGKKAYTMSRAGQPGTTPRSPFEEFVYTRPVPSLVREV